MIREITSTKGHVDGMSKWNYDLLQKTGENLPQWMRDMASHVTRFGISGSAQGILQTPIVRVEAQYPDPDLYLPRIRATGLLDTRISATTRDGLEKQAHIDYKTTNNNLLAQDRVFFDLLPDTVCKESMLLVTSAREWSGIKVERTDWVTFLNVIVRVHLRGTGADIDEAEIALQLRIEKGIRSFKQVRSMDNATYFQRFEDLVFQGASIGVVIPPKQLAYHLINNAHSSAARKQRALFITNDKPTPATLDSAKDFIANAEAVFKTLVELDGGAYHGGTNAVTTETDEDEGDERILAQAEKEGRKSRFTDAERVRFGAMDGKDKLAVRELQSKIKRIMGKQEAPSDKKSNDKEGKKGEEEQQKVTCFGCGEVGHRRTDCPKAGTYSGSPFSPRAIRKAAEEKKKGGGKIGTNAVQHECAEDEAYQSDSSDDFYYADRCLCTRVEEVSDEGEEDSGSEDETHLAVEQMLMMSDRSPKITAEEEERRALDKLTARLEREMKGLVAVSRRPTETEMCVQRDLITYPKSTGARFVTKTIRGVLVETGGAFDVDLSRIPEDALVWGEGKELMKAQSVKLEEIKEGQGGKESVKSKNVNECIDEERYTEDSRNALHEERERVEKEKARLMDAHASFLKAKQAYEAETAQSERRERKIENLTGLLSDKEKELEEMKSNLQEARESFEGLLEESETMRKELHASKKDLEDEVRKTEESVNREKDLTARLKSEIELRGLQNEAHQTQVDELTKAHRAELDAAKKQSECYDDRATEEADDETSSAKEEPTSKLGTSGRSMRSKGGKLEGYGGSSEDSSVKGTRQHKKAKPIAPGVKENQVITAKETKSKYSIEDLLDQSKTIFDYSVEQIAKKPKANATLLCTTDAKDGPTEEEEENEVFIEGGKGQESNLAAIIGEEETMETATEPTTDKKERVGTREKEPALTREMKALAREPNWYDHDKILQKRNDRNWYESQGKIEKELDKRKKMLAFREGADMRRQVKKVECEMGQAHANSIRQRDERRVLDQPGDEGTQAYLDLINLYYMFTGPSKITIATVLANDDENNRPPALMGDSELDSEEDEVKVIPLKQKDEQNRSLMANDIQDGPGLDTDNAVAIDSGASKHLVRDRHLLNSMRDLQGGGVIMGGLERDGEGVKCMEEGHFLTVKGVLHGKDSCANVLSLAMLEDKGHDVTYSSKKGEFTVVFKGTSKVHVFKRSIVGGVKKRHYIKVFDPATHLPESSLIQTVRENMSTFTKADVKAAAKARDQAELLNTCTPESHTMNNANNDILDSEVAKKDIPRHIQIWGKERARAVGNTTYTKAIPLVIASVPVTTKEQQILFIDVIFWHGLAFLLGKLSPINFLMVAYLVNREGPTIWRALRAMIGYAQGHNIDVTHVVSDGEGGVSKSLPELQALGIQLTTAAPGKHVHSIERSARTVKEGARRAEAGKPFKFPKAVCIMAIGYSVFCINLMRVQAYPDRPPPHFLVTGTKLSWKVNFPAPFASLCYAPVRDTDNTAAPRARKVIAFYTAGEPTEATHCMDLTTRKHIVVGAGLKVAPWGQADADFMTRWAERDFHQHGPNRISRIDEDERDEDMRVGLEVPTDAPEEAPSHILRSVPSEVPNEQTAGSVQPAARRVAFAPIGTPIRDEGGSGVAANKTQASLRSFAAKGGSYHENNKGEHQGENKGAEDEKENDRDEDREKDKGDPLLQQDRFRPNDTTPAHVDYWIPNSAGAIAPIPEEKDRTYYGSAESPLMTQWPPERQSEWIAVPGMGPGNVMRTPGRGIVEVEEGREREQIASSTSFATPTEERFANLLMWEMDFRRKWYNREIALTMSVKQATKKLGAEVAMPAVSKELRQMLDKKVWTPKRWAQLTESERKAVIPSTFFLKEKFLANGAFEKLKGRLVARGDEQDKSLYGSLTSPTASTSSIFAVAAIAAAEGRKVETADVPGAYLNADMEKTVHMRLDKTLSAEIVRIDARYADYLDYKGCLVVRLDKALYGCVESARLWYLNLKNTLEEAGYSVNVEDPCVFNKGMGPEQCTVIVYVDDLMATCVNQETIDELWGALKRKYGEGVVTHKGPVLSYLGMTFDYSVAGEVRITQAGYTVDILRDCGLDLNKAAPTPASEHLFDTRDESEKASVERADWFHRNVAKLLYLAKRTRPECLTAVAFLATRVTKCDLDDLKKLTRLLLYVNGTKERGIVLRPGARGIRVRSFVDAAYGVYVIDGKSVTGAVTMIGDAGPIHAKSTKQSIVTKSSTQAELVATSDSANQPFHVRRFIIEQGHDCGPVTLYQDNLSTMHLIERGRAASEKTRHISIRYFWIKQAVEDGEVVIEKLDTKLMPANILTKPLQGEQFKQERRMLTNWEL